MLQGTPAYQKTQTKPFKSPFATFSHPSGSVRQKTQNTLKLGLKVLNPPRSRGSRITQKGLSCLTQILCPLFHHGQAAVLWCAESRGTWSPAQEKQHRIQAGFCLRHKPVSFSSKIQDGCVCVWDVALSLLGFCLFVFKYFRKLCFHVTWFDVVITYYIWQGN